MLRKLLPSIAIGALSFFSIYSSAAHGAVTTSTPPAGSKVLTMPSVVSMEFDRKLLTLGNEVINSITVSDSSGQVISDGTSLVEGARVSTKISILDSTGLISVHYRTVSEDGYPVRGEYSFTVGENLIPSKVTHEKESLSLSFVGFLLIIIAAITTFIVIRRNSKR